MPTTSREIIKLLKKHGFKKLRQRGTSHLLMYNKEKNLTVPIPIHSGDLTIGTEQDILKEAGLK